MSGITSSLAANDSCSTVDIIDLTLNSSGRTFMIGGAFLVNSSDDFILQYTLSGITNPNRVKTTSTFTMGLYNSTGVQQLVDNAQTITTTAGVLTCSMVPTFTEVEARSPYTVTITPSTAIPSNGVLKMVFLSYWPEDQIRNSTILPSTITCVGSSSTSLGLSC